MKYEIIELEILSGKRTKIYSLLPENSEETLYETFMAEHDPTYHSEIEQLDKKLETIGNKTGLRTKWYKKWQGSHGDGICSLFDRPNKKLRLYFIKYDNHLHDLDNVLMVLGGGGPKPNDDPNKTATKDFPKLRTENGLLKKIAAKINDEIDVGRFTITENGIETIDDWVIEIDDELEEEK